MGVAPRFHIPGPLKKENEEKEKEDKEEKGDKEDQEEKEKKEEENQEKTQTEQKNKKEENERHIPYYDAILELQKIESEHLPTSKLQIVLSAYREICSAVATHYEDSEKQVFIFIFIFILFILFLSFFFLLFSSSHTNTPTGPPRGRRPPPHLLLLPRSCKSFLWYFSTRIFI